VETHNQKGDCYLVVDGAVLDVSRFAVGHPGGEALLYEYGGKDVSEEFYGLHRCEVLDKHAPKLCVGYLKGHEQPLQDGLSSWGRISRVPYAETFAWRGFHSPYHNEQHNAFRRYVYMLSCCTVYHVVHINSRTYSISCCTCIRYQELTTVLILTLTRRYVREFLDREVRQIAIDSETSNTACTLELLQTISKAGLLHTTLGPGEHLRLCPMPMGIMPDEYTYTHEKILQEEYARLQTPGFTDSIYAPFNIAAPPLIKWGTPAMKQDILPDVLAGTKRVVLAITEAFAGSDVAGLKTTAVKSADGTHYIVNGTKKWITGGTFSDYFVTAVRTGGPGAAGISMLLIPRLEGVETKLIQTAYSSAAGTAYVTFENVKVPCEMLLGKENAGFKMIVTNFNHERWFIAVRMIAAARLVVEECFKWVQQRKVFGQRLIQQSVIREKLGMMIAAVESVDAYADFLTYQLNRMSYDDQNIHLGGPISLLKYQATRTCHNVADQAVQCFGGRGFTKTGMGRVVETFARTYKAASVYGGSEEIMVDLGVRQALKLYPPEARL
jgi:alkylation response protein AidB-like acyl-CoA dehydrogenase